MLMSMLMREAAAELDEERWDDLAAEDLRVIEATTTEGVTVAEIARRVGITEEAGRSSVDRLVVSGHLEVTEHPAERGREIAHRTRSGQHVMARADLRIRQIEARWAQTVGAAGYRQFRTALEQLAVDHAGAAAPAGASTERPRTSTERERSRTSTERERSRTNTERERSRTNTERERTSTQRERPRTSTESERSTPAAGERSTAQREFPTPQRPTPERESTPVEPREAAVPSSHDRSRRATLDRIAAARKAATARSGDQTRTGT